MVAVEYTLLYEGTYEVLCRDPETDATKTVIVDSYTGAQFLWIANDDTKGYMPGSCPLALPRCHLHFS